MADATLTSNVRADPDRDLSWQTYLLNWAPQSGREYEVAHAAFIASWAAARAITSETLPPRITVMNDGRAMGGSDVCHTCEAHCTVINDLQTALRGLYWDNVDYLMLNKLGGMQNHWMRAARMALGMDVNDVRPTQKAEVGEFCEHGYRPTFCPQCPQTDLNAQSEPV